MAAMRKKYRPTLSSNRKRPLIVILYAHVDRRLVNKFLKMAHPVRHVFAVWCDLFIAPGDDWNRAIRDALRHADAVVIFISPALLASKYFITVEQPLALKLAKAGRTRILLAPLQHSMIEFTKLGRLQALSPLSKPLQAYSYIKRPGVLKGWVEALITFSAARRVTRRRRRISLR